MNVIVFEDHKALNLEPISLTRPVFDIRCGAKTFIERVKKLDSIDISALVVRDELVDVTRDNHPGTSVNPDRFDDGIWLNSSVLWSSGQIEEIRSTPGTGFFNDEDMIALNLSSKTIDQWMSNGGPLSMKTPKGIIKKK